jgi:hypothetical protein
MLPSNDKVVGDFGHTSDHNLIVSDIQDIRDTFLGASVAAFTYLRQDTASATYATIISPNLLGIPTAPTASAGTVTTQIATTAFVGQAIDLLIDAAPGVLDTLNELAQAIGDDPNFITSIGASVSLKLDSGIASATYLTQLAASALYIPISASYEFLRQDVASATYLPITGSVNWSNIVDKPDPVITLNGDVSGVGTIVDVTTASITVTIEKDFSLTFTGDVTGTGTVNNLGSASIALTVQPDSVALGTDTTGNYVLDLAGGEGITISGSIGEGWIPTVSINSTASVNWDNVNNKPDPIIGVNLTGDITGAASATLVDVTNGQITISTTIEPDSVALGTDTTGDYVANIFGTDNQIAVAGSGVETASVVLSLPQDINTISSPTFANLTITEDLAVDGGNITSTSSAFHLLNEPTDINIGLSATAIEIGSSVGTTNVNNNLDVNGDINLDGQNITATASALNLFVSTSKIDFAIAATDIKIGSSSGTTNINNNLDVNGDINIDGGDITTSASAFHLLNQPTNINLGLSASAIEIGSNFGTTNINNNLDVDRNVNVDGGAITTSASSFNIVNDLAYEVNFGGAAQVINIGSASGTTTVANDLTVDGDTLIYGDLTVMGSTTTVNSTTTTLDDPIITLGGDQTPTVDDNKDRGVEFKWHDGTSAQLGFFGFDDSTGRFTFMPKSTNSSEVFSGSVGGFDLDHIQFNIATITSPSEGRLVWNNDEGTLDIGLKGGNVNLQVGQENVILAFNNSGVTVPDGRAVAIDGAQGNRLSFTLANSASTYAAAHSIGLTTEAILPGELGYITTYGTVRQLNTDSYSEGTELYVSASPGILTATRPLAPQHAISVGFVQRSHAQVGSIFVRIDGGDHLEFLHDVRLNNPLSGQALLYNQSASYWQNISIADIYLRQDNASATYLTLVSSSSSYLRRDVASATYLTLVSASSSYARLDELEETVEDYVAGMFVHNQHTNVTAVYSDSSGRIILNATGGGGGSTGGTANVAFNYWFGV